MRTKAFTGVLSSLITVIMLLSLVPFKALCSGYTVDEVQELIDGIIAYKLSDSGAANVQDWIDGSITDNAGVTSEWYVLALSQSGERGFSSYRNALEAYLDSHNVSSATTRLKYALALSAAGSGSRYISDVLDTSVGKQGVMSWIYGLHVLNNGYTCRNYDTQSVVDELLSMQFADGGWAVMGENGDIDVTAMALQALAPHCPYRDDVRQAAERALDFLSQRQQDDGGYVSFGTPNPESASQVLSALSDMGIDCLSDERFIKNGNSLIDGIAAYRLPDGSFSHTAGGGYNETATVQAYYSMVSYMRMTRGEGPLFIIDNVQPQEAVPAPTENIIPAATEAPVTQPEAGDVTAVVTSPSPADVPGENVQPADRTSSAVTTASRTGTAASSASAVTTGKTTTSSASSASATSSAVTGTDAATSAAGTSETIQTVSAEASTAEDAAGSTEESGSGYKGKAIAVIIGAGAVLSLIIFAAGKRHYKNFIAVGIAAAAGVTIVLLTDIKTKDEYYNGERVHKENAIGTVTMTIRCDTVAGSGKNDHIPEDGIILDVTEFDLAEGETVYDILTEAARTYGIQVENTGNSGHAHGMVYIAGINYLYEYDFGDLSGWVYHVNGITPSRGCGDYILSDGDRIEWLYTCELGRDLDEVYEK